MSDFPGLQDNLEMLEVIEGLLGVTEQREREIVELTVELELLKKKVEDYEEKYPDLAVEEEEIVEDELPREVLVADGSDAARIDITGLLINNGCDVVATASNGEEAYDLYRMYMPTVITLDTHLPKLDGYQVIRRIKNYDPSARIIMLSRGRDRQMVLDAILAGAADYICKPFTPDRLVNAINRLLSRQI